MNRSLSPTELKRLHREWRRRTDLTIGLILDGVQQPYNVGSIFRSAGAYRVENMWLVPPTPDPAASKVAKTALGSEKLVSWEMSESGPDAVSKAKAAGYLTIAVELTDSARPLFEIDAGSKVCLVLGHEDRGVRKDTLATVDRVGFLPQLGKVGSLNVAQAATAALYEVARQRWMGSERQDS